MLIVIIVFMVRFCPLSQCSSCSCSHTAPTTLCLVCADVKSSTSCSYLRAQKHTAQVDLHMV